MYYRRGSKTGPLRDDHRPTWVYQAYDANGDPLYVGMTLHPRARLMSHRSRSKWFADAVRFTWRCYPDRWSAHVAERAAIVASKPKWNLYPLHPRSDKGVPQGPYVVSKRVA